jgi:hypothetical protein
LVGDLLLKPDGETAPSDQGCVILGPVADAVGGLRRLLARAGRAAFLVVFHNLQDKACLHLQPIPYSCNKAAGAEEVTWITWREIRDVDRSQLTRHQVVLFRLMEVVGDFFGEDNVRIVFWLQN